MPIPDNHHQPLRQRLAPTPAQAKRDAKYATLGEIRKTILVNLLSPMPCPQTLKAWLAAAGIPTLTIDSPAKRRIGPIFYDVDAIKRLIASLQNQHEATQD